jgi:hypothetical protein
LTVRKASFTPGTVTISFSLHRSIWPIPRSTTTIRSSAAQAPTYLRRLGQRDGARRFGQRPHRGRLGNATLDGGGGADVLETNSTGTNTLAGGGGGDALIVNRAGTNALFGGSGNDLFVFKESASIVKSDGSFNFGQQVISGGSGHDTLRFIINDQNPGAENALIAEFHKIEAAFDLAAKHGHAGTFDIDGLHVTGIDRVELQIDSVSTNPNTPYLITHDIALADGHASPVSDALNHLLQTADHWNLLTV